MSPAAPPLHHSTLAAPVTSPSVTLTRGPLPFAPVSFPAASCASATWNLVCVPLPMLFSLPVMPFPISGLPVRPLLTLRPSDQVSLFVDICLFFIPLYFPHCCHSGLVSLLFSSYNICKYFCTSTYNSLYIDTFTCLFPHFTLRLLQLRLPVSIVLPVSPALSKGPGAQKALSEHLLNRRMEGMEVCL